VNNTDVEALNPGCKPKLDSHTSRHFYIKLYTISNSSLKSDWLFGISFQDQQRCWSRNMLYLV